MTFLYCPERNLLLATFSSHLVFTPLPSNVLATLRSVPRVPAIIITMDSHELKVSKEGFTKLAGGGIDPLFDIVFVHGIQGHPKETWTFGEDPDPKKKKLSKLFKRNAEPAPGKSKSNFWPQTDLPKDFPTSRILTYGYDSHVANFEATELNLNTVTDHAESLLGSLVRERKGCPTRPLLFLVHSLGGLILKSVGASLSLDL